MRNIFHKNNVTSDKVAVSDDNQGVLPSTDRQGIAGYVRKALIFFVCLLPFQYMNFPVIGREPYEWPPAYIRYADEAGFLIFSAIALSLIVVSPARYRLKKVAFSKYLALFALSAFISLSLNGVSVLQGVFGIYDVVKNILVVYLFLHLDFSREDFLRFINYLTKIALFIVIFGIIAVVVAMVSDFGVGFFVVQGKRFGIYRLASLVGVMKCNYLGIYLILMILLSYAYLREKKEKYVYFPSIIVAIVLTFSRQTYLGLALSVFFLKKKFILVTLAGLIVVALMFSNKYGIDPEVTFRGFVLSESLELLSDKPLFGHGPSMFGSIGADLFGTHLYDNWPSNFFRIKELMSGVDTFWPSVWAEFGVVGLLLYLSIFVSMFSALLRAKRIFVEADDVRMSKIGTSLSIFLIALGIMGLGQSINGAFVVWTYFALVGIYLSIASHSATQIN